MGKKVPVLVTTAHRGVFFGYTEDDLTSPVLSLSGCRMAVYWSKDVRGVIGLAAGGPTEGCRISRGVDGVIREVTAVWVCTPAAVKAWEAAPWES